MNMTIRTRNRNPSASNGKIADQAGQSRRCYECAEKNKDLHHFFVFCCKVLRTVGSSDRGPIDSLRLSGGLRSSMPQKHHFNGLKNWLEKTEVDPKRYLFCIV